MSGYTLKRDILRATGLLEYQWKTLKPGVYVFNYHRIGNPEETAFDPNVFMCDQEHFASQLLTIKSRFRVIDDHDLLQLIESGMAPTEPLAMLTFDDGYRDNYELVFPMLRDAGIKAVFFLPTAYIGTNQIPWWDEVAWLINSTTKTQITLPDWGQPVLLKQQSFKNTVRSVLYNMKQNTGPSMEHKMAQLREATASEMPRSVAEKLFISWDEAREMHQHGMGIGSHAHSHQILLHLSLDKQREELQKSKDILENQLSSTVDLLAYPVGGRNSYSEETCNLAKEIGYKAAFTFIYGFNPTPQQRPFELLRIPIEENGEPYDLKYTTVFAGPVPGKLKKRK